MDTGGAITADFGAFDALNFTGFYNVALSDSLQARLAFSSRYHDGYRQNSLNSMRGDDEDNQSGRLELAWEPTPHLKTWLEASVTHEGGTGGVAELKPFTYPVGTPSPVPKGTEPVHALSPSIGDGTTFPILAPTFQNIRTTDLKWSAAYDDLPGGLTLTYLGGFNRINYLRGFSASSSVPFLFTRREHPDTYNNELRLTSPGDKPLFWQVGFYSYIENSYLFTDAILFPGASNQTLYYYFNTPMIHAESNAVFGQASYSFTPKFKITAGVRYTADDKSREGSQTLGPGAGHNPPLTLVGNQNGTTSSDKVTWLAGADYDVTPENLLYGKVSTGYKAGGFTSSNQYLPETVTSYELGSKNRFFDRHLQLDVAVYKMDYQNQQVNQYLSINGLPPAATIVNAGQSEIYGVEASAIAVIDSLGRLDLSANYLHARYKDYKAVQYWNNVNTQLAGHTLPDSPEYTLSAHFERDWKDVFGGTITARIGAKYTSNQYFDPFNFSDERQPAYVLGDGSLTYAPTNGRWSVQAYAENISNKKYFTFAGEQSGVGYGYAYGAPRTYGVRLTGRF
jgi:iron complex outermembrane receptor protein